MQGPSRMREEKRHHCRSAAPHARRSRIAASEFDLLEPEPAELNHDEDDRDPDPDVDATLSERAEIRRD